MKDEEKYVGQVKPEGGQPVSTFILPSSSFLLGAFICFQLVYLPVANVIKLIPMQLPESSGELDDDIQLRGNDLPESAQVLFDAVGGVCLRWGELTGQAQGWSLFAPQFGHQAALPAVTLATIDPVAGRTVNQVFRSRFEPEDLGRWFRLPESSCRLFNYEYRLALLYWVWSPEMFAKEPEAWRAAATKRVLRQHRSMQSYLAWRQRQFMQQHDHKPNELILSVRQIADGKVTGEQNLIRWVQRDRDHPLFHSFQAWDPVERAWAFIPAWRQQ